MSKYEKIKFTESQIVSALKEYELGRSVDDICRELGINVQTFLQFEQKVWRYWTALPSAIKDLESKYAQLQKMYADLALDNRVIKDVLWKKF